MRSRYTAYCVGDAVYLRQSWASSTRPSRIRFDADHHWRGLEIRATAKGGLLDKTGTVEFVASYINKLGAGAMHEISRFEREAGKWVYVDGIHQSTLQD